MYLDLHFFWSSWIFNMVRNLETSCTMMNSNLQNTGQNSMAKYYNSSFWGKHKRQYMYHGPRSRITTNVLTSQRDRSSLSQSRCITLAVFAPEDDTYFVSRVFMFTCKLQITRIKSIHSNGLKAVTDKQKLRLSIVNWTSLSPLSDG